MQAGHFNETVNLAALWRLPLVLVCENNGFAEFTPRSAHTVVERVSDVVAPYDLERATVDGNDVVATWDAFRRYLAAAREGGGPFLLECLTYRVRGHYEGDQAPIARRSRTRSGRRGTRSSGCSGTASPRAGSARTSCAGSRVGCGGGRREAVRFGRESPFPPLELIEEMVYADG